MTPGDMGGDGGDGGDGGGAGGMGGMGGGGDGMGGGGACAQTSHPSRSLHVREPHVDPKAQLAEDHVKALVPSSTLLGPVVPLYATPFTISLSKPLSVLKAVAPRSKPTARLVGVIVHDSR